MDAGPLSRSLACVDSQLRRLLGPYSSASTPAAPTSSFPFHSSQVLLHALLLLALSVALPHPCAHRPFQGSRGTYHFAHVSSCWCGLACVPSTFSVLLGFFLPEGNWPLKCHPRGVRSFPLPPSAYGHKQRVCLSQPL